MKLEPSGFPSSNPGLSLGEGYPGSSLAVEEIRVRLEIEERKVEKGRVG